MAVRMADLDQELDRLYGLPADEFTAARNELAKRLKKDGDAEAAAEVQALRRPSAAAAVLNELARAEPELVDGLLGAGADLRAAQEQALAGGDPEELRRATAAEREAVRELVQAARLLGGGDRKVSSDTLDRVRGTLTAVAANEQASARLRAGRMTHELDPAGFPSLALPPTPAPPRARKAPQKAKATATAASEPQVDELAERRARREERRERVKALRARVRELRREADRAQAAVGRADAAARRARKQADDAERARDEAEAKAQRLLAEVERTEAELAEAERP
jgi:hypothetical protein